MLSPEFLHEQIREKKSFLCVGLDTDISKLPSSLSQDIEGVWEFNRQIIEATLPYAIAYKVNTAFYECLGAKGWELMERTRSLLPAHVMLIMDAKRGDIGNTSQMYAKAFFEQMQADAITVAPYMGKDSVQPFLDFAGKWTFLLGLTSNAGASDFQWTHDGNEYLYEKVIRTGDEWAEQAKGYLGYVVGATRAAQIAEIRAQSPKSFFLVPGVGAQGGDLKSVCELGRNAQGGLLINASRAVIYASAGTDFAKAAADVAKGLQGEMAGYI